MYVYLSSCNVVSTDGRFTSSDLKKQICDSKCVKSIESYINLYEKWTQIKLCFNNQIV